MKFTFFITTLFLSVSILAQDSYGSAKTIRNRNIKTTDTLNVIDQYDFLSNNSDSYRDYKVIKKDWITTVRKHLIDSLNQKREFLLTLQNTIDLQNQTIDSLENKIIVLEDINSKKDKINFFGVFVNKKSYHLLLWTLIGLVSILAVYFFYKHNNANKITKDTLMRYDELDKEYNESRSKSLEREQVLSRKLLDAEKKINDHSKE